MANKQDDSNSVPGNVEDVDDLAQFRNQWKKELTVKTVGAGDNHQDPKEVEQENQEDDVHRKARDLFMQGVNYEQDGKLYEAIRYYKKAEKLVPNIERQAYKFNVGKTCANNKKEKVKDSSETDDNGNVRNNNDNDNEDDNDNDISNLCAKFGKLRTNGQCVIEKEFESNAVHIGQLPCEVLNYIMKWVVSSELDLKSLESSSQVCRGFYIAARDEEIWKLVCFRMWGSSLDNNFYASWREMFFTKPRIHFNGCYVSKMRYLREGERGFQDQETYKAWHIVEYNRYLRFFPGGQVIMALSSDDEAIIAKQLNSKSGGLNIPGAMMGRYKISDNVLICVLHKPKAVPKKTTTRHKRRGRKEIDSSYEVPDQDFHLEFYISGSKWSMLEWKHFDLVSKYSNGNENVDNFQIRDQNKYPSVRFKYVGSYQFESLAPLV